MELLFINITLESTNITVQRSKHLVSDFIKPFTYNLTKLVSYYRFIPFSFLLKYIKVNTMQLLCYWYWDHNYDKWDLSFFFQIIVNSSNQIILSSFQIRSFFHLFKSHHSFVFFFLNNKSTHNPTPPIKKASLHS